MTQPIRILTTLVVSAVFAATAIVPSAQAVQDGAPSPVDQLVCGFALDLNDVLSEFSQQVGDFDNDKLNKALDKAQERVELATAAINNGDVKKAMSHIEKAQKELAKGTATGASGSGFAEDIASLLDFRTETFVDGLIVTAGRDGLADDKDVDKARKAWQQGVALGAVGVDDYKDAAKKFAKATNKIRKELDLDVTCEPGEGVVLDLTAQDERGLIEGVDFIRIPGAT